MGEFDFGQFQQLYEYLAKKLAEGGALTPEERSAYDGLMAIANQGLNLTETGDFKSLYTAFNALADSETKKKFEELYGTGLLQDESGTIQFTRPGTLVSAMMRRGLSVRDGPVQALLSEGLRNFLDTTAKNSFAAMTNSYQAMTPIRAQNIQALQQAGGIGSTAIGRRAAVVPSAIGASRGGGGGGGGGEGPGEGPGGEPIRIPVPPKPDQPGLLDKLLPGLLTALATGGLGALVAYLNRASRGEKDTVLGTGYAENERPPGGGKDFPGLQNDPDYFAKLTQATEPINPPEYTITDPYQGMNQAAYQGINPPEYPITNPYQGYLGQYAQDDPYGINQAAYGGYQSPTYQDYQTDPYASYLQPDYTTYLQPDQYYGTSNYGWSQPEQQPMNYEDYGYSPDDYTSYGQDYQDWSSAYDTGGDSYSYDSYDYGGGGGGDSYDYGGDYSDWYSEAY